MTQIKISIITDEISADLETALELGTQWGVHDFELRGFYSERVPRFLPYQVQALQAALDRYQARIIAIGPGLFKQPLPARLAPSASLSWMERAMFAEWQTGQQDLRDHIENLLPQSLDFANQLGARLVVIFAFDRGGAPPGEPPHEAMEYLFQAAQRAQAAGLKLVVENEGRILGGYRKPHCDNAAGDPSPSTGIELGPRQCVLRR